MTIVIASVLALVFVVSPKNSISLFLGVFLSADQKMRPRRRTLLYVLILLSVPVCLLLYVIPSDIHANQLEDVYNGSTQTAISRDNGPQTTQTAISWDNGPQMTQTSISWDNEPQMTQTAISWDNGPQMTQTAISWDKGPQMTRQRTWDNSTPNETKQGREASPNISSPYVVDWEHSAPCFKYNESQPIPENKKKVKLILYWQDEEYFEKSNRHADLCHQQDRGFCKLTFDVSQHAKADAVVFHASRISITKPPFKKRRGQVWVARALESPPHWLKGYASPAWRGVFNWTMTYRTDSDIFSPVGRLVRFPTTVPKKYTAVASNKTKSIAWFVSKCDTTYKYGSEREKYVKELQKYIDVDIFGECGPHKCPKSDMSHCNDILTSRYRFYLSFENSLCQQYVTEKFFRSFREGIEVVPVVLGGHDYKQYLPEGTYINAADFRSPKDLAKYLLALSKDVHAYAAILERKSQYRVCHSRELSWCRLCEMLHMENMGSKVYKDLYRWWEEGTCVTAQEFFARH